MLGRALVLGCAITAAVVAWATGDAGGTVLVEHRLIDILVIAVCAVIACAESWEDIALYGRSKLAWLRQFLALPNGIPRANA